MSKQSSYAKVLELLKTNIGTELIKSYRTGDPIFFAKSDLPCIWVDIETSAFELDATRMDKRTQTLVIGVAISKLEFMNGDFTVKEVEEKMYDLVEGIDETTDKYKSNSIIGVLRNNYTLENRIIDQNMDVSYRINQKRSEEIVTLEARIRFVVEERLEVPSRS